jgi:DNA-3-methyladenine glycosylase I
MRDARSVPDPPRARASPRRRCAWVEGSELQSQYHDREWGVPSFDDRHLFEMLSLEGAQAGLSWSTILKKRENYRRAFAGFDAARVARFPKAKIGELLRDPGIVRHRGKIASVVTNAAAILRLRPEFGSFSSYVWQFVGGRPLQNRRRSLAEVPARTDESTRLSKDLLARGFRFVGPTICYAFMQAVGMVNDHEVGCFRYRAIAGRRLRRPLVFRAPLSRPGGAPRIKSKVR